ncbi:hypothetical protein [Nocardiopsis algeriensis]|uniref:Uncharacterized protein n=1 Tax=Nocardiopsis algeriensis TaxID=1478215 RepID=A0A841IW71_9ACTN|nr:hypothetical protein [Nocardiopsis algeriensis]MBB6120765.1 hypothetical protein [Nocardiopsis algeriensis]
MAGIHGRGGRARGVRAAGAAAATASLLALAACSGGGSEGAEITLERGESGVMPGIEPPDPGEYAAQEIEGVSIEVPEGWQVQNEGGTLCVSPPGQDACGYGSVQLTPQASTRNPGEWPKKGDAFNKEDGWGADTGSCRSLNTAASGGIGVSGADLKVADFTQHADGLKSHHSVWEVTCANDDRFEVRMWFLPISDVLLYVWSVDSQYSAVYDEIALSMDTSGYER